MKDPLAINPRDPLITRTPDAGLDLLRLLINTIEQNGPWQYYHINNAAANLLVRMMRVEHPTRAAAEKAFDEIAGRAKQLLLDHYDGGGRKPGQFPFPQLITMDRLDARETFPK